MAADATAASFVKREHPAAAELGPAGPHCSARLPFARARGTVTYPRNDTLSFTRSPPGADYEWAGSKSRRRPADIHADPGTIVPPGRNLS